MVYDRARQLKLPVGLPQGLEFLTHAAERVGYDTGQLRQILNWYGATFHRAKSRKAYKHRPHTCVDPFQVDEAVKAWLELESVMAAARSRGISSYRLSRWLDIARKQGKPIPRRPGRGRKGQHGWRIHRDVIDAVIKERKTA
jgi:hypothetical protein